MGSVNIASTFQGIQFGHIDGAAVAEQRDQDGQTDDRQLTSMIQLSAERLGAVCFEKSRLTRAARFHDGYQVCFRKGRSEQCGA